MEIESRSKASEAMRHGEALPAFRLIAQIISRAECTLARTRNDGDPKVRGLTKLIEHLAKFDIGRRMQCVHALRPVDCHDHETTSRLNLAKLSHDSHPRR